MEESIALIWRFLVFTLKIKRLEYEVLPWQIHVCFQSIREPMAISIQYRFVLFPVKVL